MSLFIALVVMLIYQCNLIIVVTYCDIPVNIFWYHIFYFLVRHLSDIYQLILMIFLCLPPDCPVLWRSCGWLQPDFPVITLPTDPTNSKCFNKKLRTGLFISLAGHYWPHNTNVSQVWDGGSDGRRLSDQQWGQSEKPFSLISLIVILW